MPPDFNYKQSWLASSVRKIYGVVSEENDSVFNTAFAPLTELFSVLPSKSIHRLSVYFYLFNGIPASYNLLSMERAAYRIIDANFNRAREATRLIEEYCRFYLDSGPLTARSKQLRHQLCSAVGRLDALGLISSRDTAGDVGIGQIVDKQLRRADLTDSFTAACKRLAEALRVLAEIISPINQAAAAEIENLRYSSYSLEKDIVLFSDAAEKFRKVRLYIVITSNLPAEVFPLAQKCAAGGADCIQLRAKSIDDDKLYAMAVEFVKICNDGGALSIINDRADVASAAGADGVHLGQNDLPPNTARKLAARPLIIGKSTHSPKQLKKAINEGVNYVSLGPVHPTPTKPTAEAVGLGYVSKGIKTLGETGIGHVAIGGINISNVEEVLKAGAKAIAVCRAVTEAENPKIACQRLKEKIVSIEQK